MAMAMVPLLALEIGNLVLLQKYVHALADLAVAVDLQFDFISTLRLP